MSDSKLPEGSALPLRARLARYPRRRAARLRDADDHNPWVLEDCPDCGGRGTLCFEDGRDAILGTCPGCAGLGTTGAIVRYFGDVDDPGEPPSAAVRGGRAACPACGASFAVADARAWTGRRHVACGRLLRLDPDPRAPKVAGDGEGSEPGADDPSSTGGSARER